MKKTNLKSVLAIILTLCMVFSMAGCDLDNLKGKVTTTPAPTAEPTETPEVEVEPVVEQTEPLLTDDEAMQLAAIIIATEKGKALTDLDDNDQADIRAKADELLADNKAKIENKVETLDESAVIALSSLYFKDALDNVKINETVALADSLKFLPYNTTDKNVTYGTSDKAVATVNEQGVVTGVKAGMATITANAQNHRASITMTVTDPSAKVVEVTGVTVNTKLSVQKGKLLALKAKVAPANATNKHLTYSTADESIATVSAYGTVSGHKEGSTTVTVTSDNGMTATCKVTVIKAKTPTAKPKTDKNNGKTEIVEKPSTENLTRGTLNTALANEVVACINAERANAGIAPLEVSATLTPYAQGRAIECLTDWSHNGNEMGYDEVLVNGTTGTNVVKAWMNSPGHREIIMDPLNSVIGVGACFICNGSECILIANLLNFSNIGDLDDEKCKITGPTTVTIGDTVTYSVTNLNARYVCKWQDSSYLTNNGNGTFTATRTGRDYINVDIYNNGRFVITLNTLTVMVVPKGGQSGGDSGSTGTEGEDPTLPNIDDSTGGGTVVTPPTPPTPPTPSCSYCGEQGHTVDNCPAKAREEEANKPVIPTCPVCGATDHTDHDVWEMQQAANDRFFKDQNTAVPPSTDVLPPEQPAILPEQPIA